MSGLQGLTYLDNTQGRQAVKEEQPAVAFDREVDRIYVAAPEKGIEVCLLRMAWQRHRVHKLSAPRFLVS